MDQSVITPLNQIKKCIVGGHSFVLQGGAGSGKTETLKQVVQYCSENHPDKRLACITHTNKAADEILERVGSDYEVSTIHSFLHSLIKRYRINIKSVLPELFCLPEFEAIEVDGYGGDEKAQRTGEHARFKKLHGKLESMRFTVFSESTEKVVGKREYDKMQGEYNEQLNADIKELNAKIVEQVGEIPYQNIGYNETPFDSLKEGTFGHDGLVQITSILFQRYPELSRIVRDKYDCIFIDEYQDTDEQIIRRLVYDLPRENGVVIGLFGDSEQAIYEDGIGSAKALIDDRQLVLIEKKDNYRCSPQVIDAANKFRSDGLEQEVAFKKVGEVLESIEDRNGSSEFWYALKPDKPENPGRGATIEEKAAYQSDFESYREECDRRLENVVALVQEELGDHVLLKLPNKSVARDAGFGTLYDMFDSRFRDTRDMLKKVLDRLQFAQLLEIINLFRLSDTDRRAFNRLISQLKKRGFSISSREDKKALEQALADLASSERSAYETMEFAIGAGLVSISESHKAYLDRRKEELKRIGGEEHIDVFRLLDREGCNTEPRMLKYIRENNVEGASEEIIKEFGSARMNDVRKEKFYAGLFGRDLKFAEIAAFYRYDEDNSDFMTMHKTKGTGIENVLIVLEEYNWTKYDFSSCFVDEDANRERQALTKKLLYVACSRAKKNLRCVRLLKDQNEVARVKEYFDICREISISLLDKSSHSGYPKCGY